MKVKFIFIFSIIIFIVIMTIVLYYNGTFTNLLENMDNPPPSSSSSPDLLIQKGEKYFLYNTKSPTNTSTNPIIFNNLNEYTQFTKENPKCPVLFLQKSYNTQGRETYNIRNGTPSQPSIPPLPPTAPRPATAPPHRPSYPQPTPLVLPSKYPAFDPRGQDIGRFTNLDAIHISGELLPVSDTPTDPNWGGTDYTEFVVNTGKYDDNRVYKPIYSKVIQGGDVGGR